VHDDEDPEYSILKARMVNKMKDEGLNVDDNFGLADITKAAERTISAVSATRQLVVVWCVGVGLLALHLSAWLVCRHHQGSRAHHQHGEWDSKLGVMNYCRGF
jgi:hypothetical protein